MTIVVIDSHPLELCRVSMPDDERALGRVAVATYYGQDVIAREAVERDAWELLRGIVLPDRPCVVRYVGREASPGIHASLYAIVPREWVPPILHETGEEWKASGEPVALFLGIVVRYQHDREHPDDFAAECADHFGAILSGRVFESVDRAIAGL